MNEQPTDIVRQWHEAEPERARSRIGIPNTGLRVLEIFRRHWPLRENQYLTGGGGQVSGLSGAAGNEIVQRYAPELRAMGTEAGRTSRSTASAARRLAERLNSLPQEIGADAAARARLADQMQRWIVLEVLVAELRPVERRIAVRPGEPVERALCRYLDDPEDDRPWIRIAGRLLAATTEVVTEVARDHGDPVQRALPDNQIHLGDTTIVLAELPTLADVEVCQLAVEAEQRCVLLTREERVLASAQLLEAAGLEAVEVDSVSRFTARLIDTSAGFEPDRRDRLIAELNQSL